MAHSVTNSRAVVALEPGFFGVVGSGTAAERFAECAGEAGARVLVREGGLALFAADGGTGPVAVLREGSVVGAVVGEVYGGRASVVEGPAAWAALDGVFAIARWDAGRGELLLYRDPSGGADLFWTDLGGGALAFASRLAHLRALVPAARAVERRSLHEYLRFLDVSAPNTLLAGVSAVEPGAVVRWRAGEGLTAGLTAGGAGSALAVPRSFAEAAEGLERRLAEAVAARVPGEGAFATFLSGGIDSALICALARQQAGDRVEAVTVGFYETAADESAVAAGIARHLGVPHRVLRFSLDDYVEAFPGWVASLEFPYADPAGLPTYLAYREVRRRHAVALDGTGADTLLGVMPARYVRLATQYAARLPRGLRVRIARWLGAASGRGLGSRVARRLEGLRPLVDFDEPEELLIRWRGWSRREIEALRGEPVSLAHTRFYRIYRSFPAGAHLERYSALLGNLPDDRVHQSAAATGLRVRCPYLAPVVQDYVRALPLEYRYRPGEPKRLLREILARHVPPALWDLPKHGFDFPLVEFLRHRDHALVRECLAGLEIIALDAEAALAGGRRAASGPAPGASAAGAEKGRHPSFVQEVVRAYCERFIAGDDGLVFKVWALVVFQAWHAATLAREDGAAPRRDSMRAVLA